MADSNDALLGRIAVHTKLISAAQLSDATQAQARSGGRQRLGEILVEKGLITPAQLQKLLVAQKQVLAKQAAQRAAADGGSGRAGTRGGRRRRNGATRGAARRRPRSRRGRRPRRAHRAPPNRRRSKRRPPGAGRRWSATRRRARSSTRSCATPSRPARATSTCTRVPRCDSAATACSKTAACRSSRRASTRCSARSSPRNRRRCSTTDGQLDLAYTLDGVGRFRANLYRQQRGLDGVFRAVPDHPPSLEELGAAEHARAAHQLPPGHGAGDGPGRLRQVVDDGGVPEPRQRGAQRSHPHDRGSDRGAAPREALSGEPAPGALAHRRASRARCAPRCARTRT